jgi:Replication-relaxation
MTNTIQRRRSHYIPDPHKTVQIWDRDLAILEAVHRYRFLTSRHIMTLIDGSPQHLLKRLRALMDGGFLMRLRDPSPRMVNSGSRVKIYGITNLGADTLAAEGIVPRGRINWTQRNGEVSDPRTGIGVKIVPHTLLISDILIEIERATLNSNGAVRFIDEPEILATIVPEQTRLSRRPLAWHVTVPYPRRHRVGGKVEVHRETRRVGVAPDRVFGLEFVHRPEGQNRLFFFLEADRSGKGHRGMPVVRSNLESSSIYKKVLAYSGTWAQGIHRERLGLRSFQVLMVTLSPTRVRHMAEAFKMIDEQVMVF